LQWNFSNLERAVITSAVKVAPLAPPLKKASETAPGNPKVNWLSIKHN
jgi:hypothetical protein